MRHEEHRHRADIDDEQDHGEELRARQQEETRGVDEGEDEEQHGMYRVLRPDDHERRRHCDESEQIEKQSLQTHIGAFFIPGQCGLPADVKQEYFKADEDDIVVNEISPTGYPMRMIRSSPAIGDGIRPNCEAYGYLLDSNGCCAYIEAYNRQVALHPDVKKISVMEKTCSVVRTSVKPSVLRRRAK